MAALPALLAALAAGDVEVVDLTAPLSASTPVLRLPEPLAWPTPPPSRPSRGLRPEGVERRTGRWR